MRKLKIVLPLMVFFALAIFVSSCSDDFTEEDALLLQGDLLEQKLRSESELATALATLQNQLAIAILEKQAELDSLKAVQAGESAEAQAEYDAAILALQGEIAAMAAEQQAAIDSLKAVYNAELDEQAREYEAEMAAMLAELQAQLDSMAAAQQGQIDQEMQLLLDSLARIGGIINYSVNVVPAGNASFGEGATNLKTDVAGIRVIASQNGMTHETVTDAGGIAHFPDMRVGNVAVTVLGSEVDHTDLRFVTDLSINGSGSGVDYSQITRNAGTRVALFPVGDSPLAATLNGQITWEQDLTNDEREAATVGIPVLARLNANASGFRARYFNTSANGINGLELGGTVISMAYDPAVSRGAVVDADGTYEITGAPASLDGLELELVINDFAADQTLLLNQLNDRPYPRTEADAEDNGKVANVRTFFSTSGISPTAVPTVASAFVMVPAPTNVYEPGDNGTPPTNVVRGSGATAEGVVGPLSGGIQSIAVTNTGSGYSVAPIVSLPAPETIGGVQATAVATINANGEVQNIVVTNAGSGYQGNNYTATITPATVNATAVASVTYSVTGATAGTSFDATAASPAAFGNAGVYTLTSVAPTVTVNGGNGGDPDAQITAKMTTAVYGATVTAGGTGYTSAPSVSISQPGGDGTGAQGVANLRKQVSTISDRVPAVTPPANLRSGFYRAAPAVTFNQPAGATRAEGTAVLGTTGRVNSDPNANLGAFQWWAPGVYYTTTDQLNVRRPRLQDSVAVAGGANNAVLTFTPAGGGNGLNPSATFEVSARRMGWITDNGGTGFDVTVEFTIQNLNPTVNAQQDQGGANITYDRELRVSNLTVAAQGTGYDAANLPVVAVNIASLLGPSGSFDDVNNNPNGPGAGYEEFPAASGDYRLIQNSGTNPLNFEFRSQANLQTALIVERQVASITVTNPGSYALGDAITFTLAEPSPVPPATAVLLGGTFEAGTEGAGVAAVGNEFRINTTNTVESVTITQIGSGYDPADLPTIEFLGGGGTGAAATLVLAQGVAGYIVDNGSFGYTQAATVTLTGGTIVAGSPARTAPALTYGDGRVTSAQILNPGSGIMAPNGTLRGTIQGAANQVAGNAGNAEFTFTVTGGQLSSVTIDKVGAWTNPGFPITNTNFVINVAAHDGTGVAVGTASNTNARIRAAANSTNTNLPIMGVVDTNVLTAGSGYTLGASATFAAPVFAGTGASTATGSAVLVGGSLTDVTVTNSGVYQVSGNNAGPVVITIAGFSEQTAPGTPAVPGTYVGQQAYVTLTVDPNTGRVVGGTVTNGGSGYESIPDVTVYPAIPGVGSGAEVEILNVSAITSNTNPNTGGTLSGIRVNNGGSGYFGRNYPSAQGVMFYGTNNTNMVMVVSGGTHAKDIYLGTGQRTIEN
ncbi:hypothetical protein ACFCT7_06530 [Fulvivirgaceae bacterium LMO-SS25]